MATSPGDFFLKVVRILIIGVVLYEVLMRPVFGDDILLDLTKPVATDKKIFVATYYRNEPNFFYFTLVYKYTTKFYSKLSFDAMQAGWTHYECEKWARRAHYNARLYNEGEIPEEKFEIIPFVPDPYADRPKPEKKEVEGVDYWIIKPSRQERKE